MVGIVSAQQLQLSSGLTPKRQASKRCLACPSQPSPEPGDGGYRVEPPKARDQGTSNPSRKPLKSPLKRPLASIERLFHVQE